MPLLAVISRLIAPHLAGMYQPTLRGSRSARQLFTHGFKLEHIEAASTSESHDD
jgi:hypothetical protein